MNKGIKKWIWQHNNYPNFNYDKSQLSNIVAQIEYNRGLLDGISISFNDNDIKDITLQTLLDEAVNTSQIEGEILRRDSVRSSLLKKFNTPFDISQDTSTHQSDNLVEILVDCSTNHNPLTIERLHGWHNALFENRYSAIDKIRVASFRDNDDMEVVSGFIGREKIHYKAPPSDFIESDIGNLLKWCNDKSSENIYIKSAIAHLWFVIIHPYDDGNGRIARAITDYLLSQGNKEFKLYSISSAIYLDRKGYYEILDKTTNLFYNRLFDITPWIIWHLKTVNEAMKLSLKSIQYIIQKTKFWDRCRDKNLNPRQIKVLSKILDIGIDKFEGGLTTKKYMAMTKKSKATVIRDIKELLEYGCIKQIEGSSGRNIRYEIVV
jgi:Fic family protein